MQFKDLGLDNRLLKNLAHYNFKQATEIQQQAIPLTIAGRDLLASSKTGSGKTLAFVLPMLHKSLKTKAFSAKDPRGLIWFEPVSWQSRCMVSCAPCWVV